MKSTLILIISFIAIFLVFTKCKKEDLPEYTISGVILKAPDQSTPAPKLQWEVVVRDEGRQKNKSLGFFTPDAKGSFTFTYPQTVIDGPEAKIGLYSDGPGYYHIEDLGVNKNITDTFYTRGPALGTLKIYLKPSKPLGNDTLFFGYGVEKGFDLVLKIDTIRNEFEGFWGEIRVPTPQKTLHWGRGYKEFYYDGFYDELRWSKHLNAKVEGDPVINEVTIEY